MSELKARLTADMKTAMKAGDKPRLGTIRLVQAAIKQREVDERIELTDADVLAVIEKAIKQRRESLAQFEAAAREDLASKERDEIEHLLPYLPAQLSEAEVAAAIDAVIAETGAEGMRDMGKVMGVLKARLQGQADMAAVSAMLKGKLAG